MNKQQTSLNLPQRVMLVINHDSLNGSTEKDDLVSVLLKKLAHNLNLPFQDKVGNRNFLYWSSQEEVPTIRVFDTVYSSILRNIRTLRKYDKFINSCGGDNISLPILAKVLDRENKQFILEFKR